MSTFSPWFHGNPTPSPSTYADMGSIKRAMAKRDDSAPPVAMPHNTTTVINQQAPQRQQRQQQQIPTGGMQALSKMIKGFMGPGDVTGTGESIPGYSMGMDISGDIAMLQADAVDPALNGIATATEAEQAAISAGAVAPEAASEGILSNLSLPGVGAAGGMGLLGGRIGSYFGNWVGDQAGIGGKREREAIGGVLGGAAAGALAGSAAGGVGAIPGAFIGGLGGAIANFSAFL
jgi:hypothetical protein